MDHVRYEVRYQTFVHRVQHPGVVLVGDEQYVFEVFQVENVHALEPGETAVRIVDVLFFGPFLHPVSQRLEVRIAGQQFLETDAGRPDRQVRFLQVFERVDVGIVHRSVQERHQRTLKNAHTVKISK